MKKLISILAIAFCLFLVCIDGCFSNIKCNLFNRYEFYLVFNKEKFENIIINSIKYKYSIEGDIEWMLFAECFELLGDEFKVSFKLERGFNSMDVIRFTYDTTKKGWWIGVPAPGASNGVFTAIFNVSKTGEIAIVRRGGKLDWLRFE